MAYDPKTSEGRIDVSYDIRDYIRLYRNAIPETLREEILTALKEKEFVEHTFYDATSDEAKPRSGDQELEITGDYYNENIMKVIWDVLHLYHEDLNYYWYNSWLGYTAPRWNRYTETKMMDLHCDHIKSMFEGERKGNPTLTVLGLLNDTFTGGEFLMWNDDVIELHAGDLLVFPSSFQYPHRVAPVTSGVRHSFVSWVW